MSTRRKPARANRYRAEYLRSHAWVSRRARWFAHHRHSRKRLVCAACHHVATPVQLELHHNTYRGVFQAAGTWVSREKHTDLIPLHPYCHELLHRLMDRDAVHTRGARRVDSSAHALGRLRAALSRIEPDQ